MPFFPVDFEHRPESILDWRFYSLGPPYWQTEVLDNLLAQQKAGKLSHEELLRCLEQASQLAQSSPPTQLLECLRKTIHAAQSVYHSVRLAAVQKPVQFAVTAVPTQSIPQPVIQPTQSIMDPRIAREKLRKREQRRRRRSFARKATQTTERETVSQPHQGTLLVSAAELGTITSGHETAGRMETTWPTAGSLGHAKQGDREVLAAMGLHGWMFRDSG